ncbi:MAG: acetyltransferase [Bacillota bacterium]
MTFGTKDVILIGAGGHSKSVIDAINSKKEFYIVGITDFDMEKENKTILSINILGSDDKLYELYDQGLRNAFISIGITGENEIRGKLFKKARDCGYNMINVLHRSAVISPYAKLGQGIAVLAGAIVNAEAKIADNCIINTGSIIEHDCIIGNNVHIAPGAKLAGNVKVGDNCLIGIGAVVIQNVTIGDNTIIGAGSIVLEDIPSDSIAVGTPAKVIRKR